MTASASNDARGQPGCCAVVVNYRTVPESVACIETLERLVPELPVVLVENGSEDGSLERLKEVAAHRPGLVVIGSKRNRGFAGGNNKGIDYALDRWPGLRWVLLLNPDTIPQEGFLEHLIATGRAHPEAGLIGGRVLSRDGGRVLYENGRLRRWTLGRSHVSAPMGQTDFETGFITGALMLIDARILRDGLRFDERYFMYVEDLDLCQEVLERGRTLRVNLEAMVRHDERASQREDAEILPRIGKRQLYYLTRNKVLFVRKWLSFSERWSFYFVAFVAKPLLGVFLIRRVGFLRTYFSALVDGVRGRSGRLEQVVDRD